MREAITLVREHAHIRIFILSWLMVLCSVVRIDLWFTPVPMTLQVLGVLLVGLTTAPQIAVASQLLYVIYGVLGLPVFAGGGSGIAYLFGPTGGYLFGFVLAVFVISSVPVRTGKDLLFIRSVLGILSIYLVGSVWLTVWFAWLGLETPALALSSAWRLGVVPFLGLDMIKAVIAYSLVRPIQKVRP